MKKFTKRFTVTAALLGAACISMSGCGKMTAEKLLPKIDEAVDGRTMTFAECVMDLGMTFDISEDGTDASMDMAIDMDIDMWMNEDPVKSYCEGTVGMDMMGFDFDTEMRAYMMEDGDVMATYMYSDMTEEWEYSEEEFDKEEYKEMNEVSTLPMTERFSDVTLDEETTELNGREVYVLRINCTGEDLEALMGQYNNAMLESAGLGDVSLKGLKIPAVYYIDKETFLPVKMELSIEGMAEMMNEMLGVDSGSSDDSKGLRGEEDSMASMLGDINMSVEEITCTIALDNISYDPQSVPTVTDEIIESVKNADEEPSYEDDFFTDDFEDDDFDWEDETDYLEPLADGSYNMTLDGYDVSINVPVPEGYEDWGDQYPDMIMYGSSNYDSYVYYELYDQDMYDTYLDSYSTMNSTTMSSALGEAEVYWEADEYGTYYYAFVKVSDCYVSVTLMDMDGQYLDAETSLQPMLDILSEAK